MSPVYTDPRRSERVEGNAFHLGPSVGACLQAIFRVHREQSSFALAAADKARSYTQAHHSANPSTLTGRPLSFGPSFKMNGAAFFTHVSAFG
jgi:hypothetical protein